MVTANFAAIAGFSLIAVALVAVFFSPYRRWLGFMLAGMFFGGYWKWSVLEFKSLLKCQSHIVI